MSAVARLQQGILTVEGRVLVLDGGRVLTHVSHHLRETVLSDEMLVELEVLLLKSRNVRNRRKQDPL